ncbi:MAG: RluA family pseudouridine synthase [Saprospiraceae bacterium]|nr:RluA family pseudouridine synthase [Bacteroidia bacterium]NNL91848.1 RluA family pseudouridine synthase [Saprospiraceae bacterium]
MGKQRWEILFEDDHIIVINKPAGLLTIPDRYDPDIPNLLSSLSKYRDNVFVNHRLDKDTSGIILFSKTENAHAAFSKIFEERKIDKKYKAIVHGVPIEEVGQIELKIAISKNKRKQMVIDQKGKISTTKYRILKSWINHSLLELKIITGRMHQIRIHMKAINCPIVADSTYGIDDAFYLSTIKRKYRKSSNTIEKPLLSRMALHSHELSFIHPITNKEVVFNAPLPKDMRAVVSQLDKNQSR